MYRFGVATEHLPDAEPLVEFERLFADAKKKAGKTDDATVVSLATADGHGRPSARIVLLKGFDERGFVFYTNPS